MKNLRSILMPLAIILGILLPQAHVLSPMMPFLIGSMMFLTFVTKIPPQTHGYTFKIEARAFVASLVLIAALWGVVELFGLPREVLLGGAIIALCPPANAAPAMAKMLGGSASLALKIFLSGNLIACFSIPIVFGYLTGTDASLSDISMKIFNTIQPIISIPLAFALGLRAFYPELADRAAKFQKYTMFVWTFSVFVILVEQRQAPDDGGHLAGALYIAFCPRVVCRKEPPPHRRLAEHGAEEYHARHLDCDPVCGPRRGACPYVLCGMAEPGFEFHVGAHQAERSGERGARK